MIRPGIRRLFRLPLRRRDLTERDLDEEIRLHLELRAEQLQSEGMSPEAARAEAMRRFGLRAESRQTLQRAAYRRNGWVQLREWISGVEHDIRHAVRLLRKSPGLLALPVLTLALGIGANVGLFSVVHSILLRPLPYPDADRLVVLWQDHQERGGTAEENFNLPDFSEVRTRSRALSAVAAVFPGDAALTGEGAHGAERLATPDVSHGYFDLLGVRPETGRLFRPEDETPTGEPLAVLSHDLWRRRFGADPRMVGRSIVLDGEPLTIIGVAEAGFRPPEGESDLWRPLRTDPTGASWRFRVLRVYGRLSPGLSLEQAREDLEAVALQLASEYPERNASVRFRMEGLHERVVGSVRTPLWVLLGAAGLVLLLACANLAGLLLARSAVRERELAIRAALGAGRGRIVRQLLIESLALATVGGLVGVGLAYVGLRALVRLAPAGMPRLDEVGVSGSVLAFAVALSFATAIAFGLAPALRVAWSDLRGALSGGGAGDRGSTGSERGRGALVVGQVALALVLLVGAGLLAGSLAHLLSIDPGFNPSNVLTAELRAPRSRYPERSQVAAFYNQLEERVAALPGVRSVGSVTVLPLAGESRDMSFRVEGRGERSGEGEPRAHYRFASPGYFRALRIAVRAGRVFTPGDRSDAPGAVVINETLARRLWPGDNPVGQRIRPEWSQDEWFTVVGVVADVRHGGLDQRPLPEVYFAAEQLAGAAAFRSLVVRTDSDPLRVANQLREVVRELDPAMPLDNVSSLEARLDDAVAIPRMHLSLFGLFAALALGIAALGIYGVLSAAVVRRTREIGIRMALGGRRRDVLRLIVGRGLALTVTGAVLGLIGALALSSLMRGMLFGIAPIDPLVYGGMLLLLVGVALLASYLPARRAADTDPMIALRRG